MAYGTLWCRTSPRRWPWRTSRSRRKEVARRTGPPRRGSSSFVGPTLAETLRASCRTAAGRARWRARCASRSRRRSITTPGRRRGGAAAGACGPAAACAPVLSSIRRSWPKAGRLLQLLGETMRGGVRTDSYCSYFALSLDSVLHSSSGVSLSCLACAVLNDFSVSFLGVENLLHCGWG